MKILELHLFMLLLLKAFITSNGKIAIREMVAVGMEVPPSNEKINQEGSVYELSGSEVCLSTGDLVKVIGLNALSVFCEEIATGNSFELSAEYSGQFTLIAEDLPYNTIEEIVGLCPIGVDACGSFSFKSRNKLNVENFTVPAEEPLTLLLIEVAEDGTRQARCQLTGQNMVSAEILLPLSLKGEFYECECDRGYSLQEIMTSARLKTRRFRSTNVKTIGGPIIFSPVYEIKAIMHMRKDIVKFPSTLEVDVQDVTEQFEDLVFVTPLSIAEVASQPQESFPTMAEILEGPGGNTFFKCNWIQELYKGNHLVLHGLGHTQMVLASTPKGRKEKKYFLISQGYSGRMRRKAREFVSVYELYMASCQCPGLKVSVTRHCEAVEEEGIPALSVGEQLEVLDRTVHSPGTPSIQNLICKRTTEVDDEDDEDEEEDSEELSLPLFMAGHFMEKLTDNKKYNLKDLINKSLPLDIKVVTRDKELEPDPLVGLTSLKLEETFIETVVLIGLPNKPDRCFELPVRWLQMSLCFTSEPLPWPDNGTPKLYVETVTEVTENFYHEYHKATDKVEEPPPRPPKRKPSTASVPKKSKSKPGLPKKGSKVTEQLENLSLGKAKVRRPPAPPLPDDDDDNSMEPPPILPRKSVSISESITQPNTYVRGPIMANSARRTSDSDHDYETVDETFKNTHDSIMHY